ncbi:hypothetical protein SEA_QOBBIT_80 [Mycobacterium phage Qobbit]|nr:hypothetical protein SEA_QOBBIT_80 [Mycobacterium phage Qobbit]AXC35091.1 hypothetical protein SEA_PRIYA_80 [Mycobacterium phage Priya]
MEETEVMVPVKGQVFECRVVYHGTYKIEITTAKVPGWRKAHRKIANRENYPFLWITHIEHDPHVGNGRGGVVTTTWES